VKNKQAKLGLPAIAAVVGVVALTAAAVFVDKLEQQQVEAPVRDPQGHTVGIGPDTPASNFLAVVLDNTASGVAQRPLLNTQLATIARAAALHRADVEVITLDAFTDTSVQVLAHSSFAGRCAKTDNPECRPESGIATKFIATVNENIERLTPAPMTDLPGALIYLARHRRELGSTVHFSALIVGDSVSTAPGCDFSYVPLEADTFTATARHCLGGRGIDLKGMNVYLAGVGESLDHDVDRDVLRATPGLVSALVRAARGVPRLVDLLSGPGGLFE
jgi:hypothetical protein